MWISGSSASGCARISQVFAYDLGIRLLEREHPLDVLEERARRAAAGHGSVVLVAGEAGIGKTVLLRAFVERARAQPLWGMCDSLSTPRPLGPLRDVADELGPPVPALLRGTAAAQHEIFAAVLDALRSRPRVFVVEDLHWADEATLDLVRFLARRIAGLPLLLVLSYRDAVGADHPLSPVLGDLVASPGASRLQLTPLSRSAIAALVDGHGLDPADLHRRTAGNPFFLSQILAQPDAPMPASVRDAVLARTSGLAPAVRRSLELLSCTPEPVGPELLDALSVSTATVGLLAATGLIDRHGRAVAFRHEIARSAILGAAVPGSERALHAAMIEALETIDAEPSVLAHHAAAAGDVPRVLRYAPAAAAEASRPGPARLPGCAARRHAGGTTVRRPGGADRGRAGRRHRAARHRVDRGRGGPAARRRPGWPGRAARGHGGGPAVPARRPRDDTDEQPLPPRRPAGALHRCRGVGRARAAHQRGARHPDLHRVPARRAGAAAAAPGAPRRGRAGRPRRAPVRRAAPEPAVAPPRARHARGPQGGPAGEPAPGRAVAAGQQARQSDHGRGRRGRARRERLDHPAPRPPAGRPAGGRALHPGVRRSGRRAAAPAALGTAPRRRRRPAGRPPGGGLPPGSRGPALRAGAGPVGRRYDRRPAGGAPPARRARRPGGGRPVPRPAARGGREQRPAGPVACRPRQPGRADRAPAGRAGPAGGRFEQRRDRRAAGHLPQDRGPSRVRGPGQAGRPLAGRGGGRRVSPRGRGKRRPA